MKRALSRREFLKLMGLFPLLSLPGSRRVRGRESSASPNILFLVFDTLSARHISLYGYPRETMPNLARFAERATVFHRNYSAGSFTTSGTASLLTGLLPATHRALQAYGTVAEEHRPRNLFSLFRAAGYHTLSFSQNLLVNILVKDFIDAVEDYVPADAFALAAHEFSDDLFFKDYGIATQAERTFLSPLGQFPNSLFLSLVSKYVEEGGQQAVTRKLREKFPRGLPQNHGLVYVLEDLVDWAKEALPGLPQPYLAYLHIMPPHDPYNPRVDFIGRYAEQPDGAPEKPVHFFSEGRDADFLRGKREHYDEYIAYVDAEFGRLIDALEAQGALENSWVVFASDHGELFERGIYRHITPVLYEGVIGVPLLMRAPGQRGRVDVVSPTNNVDILPTLLQHAGIAIPSGLEGRVLPPWGDRQAGRLLFAVDAKSNPKRGPLRVGTIAAMQGAKKLVHFFGYDGYESEYEFYDLAADPEEMVNLYDPSDVEIAALQAEIESLRQRGRE